MNRRRLGSWTDPEPWTVALLLLTGAGILARHPLARLIGSDVDSPAPSTTVATAPARAPEVTAAGALVTGLAPAPTHPPRDPFRALVAASGAVLAPVAGVAASPAAQAATPVAAGSCNGPLRTTLPGDTLWTVAATAIRSSDGGRITIAWHRLYAANRARLGPDPELLPVGKRLCLPSGM